MPRVSSGPGSRPSIGCRAVLLLAVCAIAASCGPVVRPSSGREVLPTVDPQRASAGIVAEASGNVTRTPLSTRGLIEGVSYQYQMPACEATSPNDFDGSFWDANSPTDLAKTTGKRGYFTLMGPDTAVFRADDDAVVVLTRHLGNKAFTNCS